MSASKIKEKARVVAMDLRGHGKSITENNVDLSIEVRKYCKFSDSSSIIKVRVTLLSFRLSSTYVQTMCNDVLAVLKAMYGDSPPAIVLVGHRFSLLIVLYLLAIF